MASREQDEKELESVVAPRLKAWLGRVRDRVMAPFRQSHVMPDPNAVYQESRNWDDDVDTILTHVGRIAEASWNETMGTPNVSRHAFTMAQLAQTRNLLVRIPDQVANLIFAEITDTVNAGGDVDAVANKVDDALNWTGSENWPNRAKVIAVTEVTRARNAGVQGAGTEMSRVTGRILTKTWRAHHDEKTRATHRAADEQTVPFYQPFMVGGVPMLYPGDETAPPEEVINCRCDMVIRNEVARG